MVRRYVAEVDGRDLEGCRTRYAFVGDSPNDEPMFGFFPLAFGVANVGRFLRTLASPPAYVTPSGSGAGFAELVAAWRRGRRG